MISIVIGLGLLLVVASVYIVKLRFELSELRSDAKLAAIKQRLMVDYIDTLSKEKQAPAKKEKK